MQGSGDVVVVRLGHRPGRDDRMTTHVGLTARALGADRFVLVDGDDSPLDRIDDVTSRFGGPFVTQRVSTIRTFLDDWSGALVHLTMYGLPVQDVIDEVRGAIDPERSGVAIIVGAEKVPFSVYEAADWNVAVTNQPHSEVASLAVLLDRLFDGATLDRDFQGGSHRVVPQKRGKRVEDHESSQSS